MAVEYEKAISIKEAIEAINKRYYLLPAIQRKFVWSSHQICMLFDSIMQGYPINTFMMWEITSDQIKNDYKFYEFLKNYCHRFDEDNPHIKTNASFDNFKAIIDGQQRLTSFYIGLCGTYAYKQPRLHWPSTRDEDILPSRKLYLDLLQPYKAEEDELFMYYNFKFLTDSQYQDSLKEESRAHYWFCLHKILEMSEVDGANYVWSKVVKPYLENNGLSDNDFSNETLCQLYNVIRVQKLINYFKEASQEIDHVLDVFIRTNSGGTKLDFSDLLTSIAVAHWDGDFRKELEDLTKLIHQSNQMGFYVERDWILKTCLMLTDVDVRFKVKNFKTEQVERIQMEWKNIKECIKQTFIFIRRIGINPESLTSKNAVISICYYLYKKQIDGQYLYVYINNLSKYHDYRSSISQWLYMALLKGIFGGQADSILSSMRELIDKNLKEDIFPVQQIIARYKTTNKDLRFDEEYIEGLLDIQYGEGRCRALLHLLFPEMNATEIFHIDHLHPKIKFDKNNLKQQDFLKNDEALFDFYCDQKHWNSITNLHLLNDSQNTSKNDSDLKKWIEDKNVHLTDKDLLVEGVNLEFSQFKNFYEQRRLSLKNRLKSRVEMSASLPTVLAADDSDEEVVEDAIV